MLLLIECIIACLIFTIIVLPPLYKNPMNQIMSYPTKIRKRVESLPEYKNNIKKDETKHITRKIIAGILLVMILGLISYYSGAKTFIDCFKHSFILFLAVNIYDLVILDILIFCHSKTSIIPGTEDMIKEYRSPWHHIRGFFIGTTLGCLVSLLSSLFILILF
ncbi:MAG: hypothetical protein R3Y21_03110 [Mycoplasmatota bacterium]